MMLQSMSIWDQCQVNDQNQKLIADFDECYHRALFPTDSFLSQASSGDESTSVASALQQILVDTEMSCQNVSGELHNILESLVNISGAHNDIASRTNSLMNNCENLLEEQVPCLSVEV